MSATPRREVDARGRPCPQPIIALRDEVGLVEVGHELAVAADDPAARHDVPAWCRMTGQHYVGEEAAADGVPVYVVRRQR
ncbi:sulfurtransferase TusA family protein [Nocardioides sp.]|uniref:sulfurtransferase TusA family protein n=1 Tax=Nocardioides sp. TaxID=35761 RepID=UPI003511AA85